ncbi:hypothetical protein BDN71DRAFT_79623 [Pleurotus eryngii]|uniref:Uncharacterized protein n=1 Tax=Pleurotus eryngii TaxID=5323 RepID=A0A9P6A4M2_PLEER|nr:hypothetical protein BDN71DRAFT_79623 [Pleurotus eryngii]
MDSPWHPSVNHSYPSYPSYPSYSSTPQKESGQHTPRSDGERPPPAKQNTPQKSPKIPKYSHTNASISQSPASISWSSSLFLERPSFIVFPCAALHCPYPYPIHRVSRDLPPSLGRTSICSHALHIFHILCTRGILWHLGPGRLRGRRRQPGRYTLLLTYQGGCWYVDVTLKTKVTASNNIQTLTVVSSTSHTLPYTPSFYFIFFRFLFLLSYPVDYLITHNICGH